jgi:GT2 family glycosyltransferase
MRLTGIVILNYNNYTDTVNCIKSIIANCLIEQIALAIIDNNSEDDSIQRISCFFEENKIFHRVLLDSKCNHLSLCNNVIISSRENVGYARGNNLGINYLINLNVEYILVLNNDIILSNNIITPLKDVLEAHKELGLVSPLLLRNDGKIEYGCCRKYSSSMMLLCSSLGFLGLPFIRDKSRKKYLLEGITDLVHNKIIYCDILLGACIFAKRTTWQLIGGFDENTFLYYEEDILFERLKNVNLKSAVIPAVSAIHLGGRTTNKVTSDKLVKIEMKSLLYYLKKYRNLSRMEIELIRFNKLFYMLILVIARWKNSLLRKKS